MGPTSREGPALALDTRHARAVNRACPVLSGLQQPATRPACIACIVLVSIGLLLGIGREGVTHSTAGTVVRQQNPTRTPSLVCASSGLSSEPRPPITVQYIRIINIIITLPIVLIQLAEALDNNFKLAGLHLHIPPAAMSSEHGMEKQCTYQSPAFCRVPVLVSDSMLQTTLHQQ